jgi:hypothetical protein
MVCSLGKYVVFYRYSSRARTQTALDIKRVATFLVTSVLEPSKFVNCRVFTMTFECSEHDCSVVVGCEINLSCRVYLLGLVIILLTIACSKFSSL